jgi:hypothetical protein
MGLTANAWVGADSVAHINFWSDEGWTDPTWSMTGSIADLPDPAYISLYSPWDRGGQGVISGNVLTITLAPCPPSWFTLVTEHGTKRFLLSDVDFDLGSALVGTSNRSSTNFESYETVSLPRLSLIYFGEVKPPLQGRISGQLQKDGKLKAVVGGNAIDGVSSSDGRYWMVPGIKFSDFFWQELPSEPTEYDFVFSPSPRSGSTSMLKFKVVMDLNEIYSPTNALSFNIEQDHTFKVAMGVGALDFS